MKSDGGWSSGLSIFPKRGVGIVTSKLASTCERKGIEGILFACGRMVSVVLRPKETSSSD